MSKVYGIKTDKLYSIELFNHETLILKLEYKKSNNIEEDFTDIWDIFKNKPVFENNRFKFTFRLDRLIKSTTLKNYMSSKETSEIIYQSNNSFIRKSTSIKGTYISNNGYVLLCIKSELLKCNKEISLNINNFNVILHQVYKRERIIEIKGVYFTLTAMIFI